MGNEEKKMKTNRLRSVAILLFGVMALASLAKAQNMQIQGVINGRSGSTMTVQTDSGNVPVLLTPDTQAEEVEGIFHARKKQLMLTALVPGLSVSVQGSYNAQNQLVANTVRFKGSSLQTATDIQAGVAPVQQQEQTQQQELAQQEAKLQQQQQQLTAEQAEQAAANAKIAANKAAIAVRGAGRLQHMGRDDRLLRQRSGEC
jgi:OOP family OmpA-OmpF porin